VADEPDLGLKVHEQQSDLVLPGMDLFQTNLLACHCHSLVKTYLGQIVHILTMPDEPTTFIGIWDSLSLSKDHACFVATICFYWPEVLNNIRVSSYLHLVSYAQFESISSLQEQTLESQVLSCSP
jgi:hypothetical protein